MPVVIFSDESEVYPRIETPPGQQLHHIHVMDTCFARPEIRKFHLAYFPQIETVIDRP